MKSSAHFLFGKTNGVNTPLAEELSHGDDCDVGHLRQLLKEGAAETVFVKGSNSNSMYCTLPMAPKPASSVVSHEPLVQISSPAIIGGVDNHLSNFIHNFALQAAKHEGTSTSTSTGTTAVSRKTSKIPRSVAVEKGFKVGDIVGMKSGRASSLCAKGTVTLDASDDCLGDADWHRRGVIVSQISKKNHSPILFCVRELISGNVCDYASTDLVFGDGSDEFFEFHHLDITGVQSSQQQPGAIASKVPSNIPQVPTCKNGHGMVLGSYTSNTCNGCAQSIICNYRCSSCDFDLCPSCSTAAVAAGKSTATTAGASSVTCQCPSGHIMDKEDDDEMCCETCGDCGEDNYYCGDCDYVMCTSCFTKKSAAPSVAAGTVGTASPSAAKSGQGTIPLKEANITVSSNSSARGRIADDTNLSDAWTSNGSSGTHWFEVAIPDGHNFPSLEIYTRKDSSYSPEIVTISVGETPGSMVVAKKDFKLTQIVQWSMLMTSDDMRKALGGRPVKHVRVHINRNHGGCDCKVAAVRLIPDPKPSATPLQVGERVQLSSRFTENGGDGWCLGHRNEQRTGIVVATPSGSSKGKEQRNVIVMCDEQPSAASPTAVPRRPLVGAFRACWLERAKVKICFSVGDLVQLNPSLWDQSHFDLIGGKCLGDMSDNAYGIVTDVGPVRRRMQRNVEVVRIEHPGSSEEEEKEGSKERTALGRRVSLYPALCLVKASPLTIPSNAALKALALKMRHILVRPDGSQVLDTDKLVSGMKMAAWSSVANLKGISAAMEAFNDWISDCRVLNNLEPLGLSPHDMEPHFSRLCRLETASTSDGLLSLGNPMNESKLKSTQQAVTDGSWPCKVCSLQNTLSSHVCSACGTKGQSWTCPNCTQRNKVNVLSCNKCKKRPDACTLAAKATPGAKAGVASASLTKQVATGSKEERIQLKDSDVIASTGQTSIPKIITDDKSTYWESSGSKSWVEVRVPEEFILTGLCLYSKDFGSYSPKDVTISVVDFVDNQVAKVHESGEKSSSKPVGCTSTCTKSHGTSDLCLVCGCRWGSHSGHNCNDSAHKGKRGSFVGGSAGSSTVKSFSNNDDKPLKLTEIARDVTVPKSMNDWTPLLTAQDCLKADAAIIRIQINSNHDGGSNSKIASLKLMGRHRASDPWSCVVCLGYNDDFAKCQHCGLRKTMGTTIPPTPKKQSAKTSFKVIDSERFKILPSDQRVVAFNTLVEAVTKGKAAKAMLDRMCDFLDELNEDESDDEDGEEDDEENSSIELGYNKEAEVLPVSPTLSVSSLGPSLPSCVPDSVDLRRQESEGFWANDCYEALPNISSLVSSRDKAGNSAIHHAGHMRLPQTFQALAQYGADRWRANLAGETPQGLYDGVSGSPRMFQLHRACCMRSLISDVGIVPYDIPESYDSPPELQPVVEKIKNGSAEEAIFLCTELADAPDAAANPRYLIYRALATLCADYGSQAAMIDVEDYLSALESCECSIDPCYFYVMYSIWKVDKPQSKVARGLAGSALAALRQFPVFSKHWLTESDNIDSIVDEEEAAANVGADDDDDDEEEDDIDEVLPADAPENEWKLAKFRHKAVSPSMDKLMQLTGLKQVKERAMEVFKATLLGPHRPAQLDDNTTMNFLFIGNPGCGKTTVAELLAQVMVELGFRKNDKPVFTNAGDILKEKDPVGEFEKMVEVAKGGTIFIDEAYLFRPAPRGSNANASNAVLDYLLKVCETMRETTTFILAGYKEDILNLLTYNEGFPSRFPKVFTFNFEDYTGKQLRKILVGMVTTRGFKFESKKSCGVSLSKVLANRIARGRGAKGFGNAREVRNQLEAAIGRQHARLGSLLLHADVGGHSKLTEKDHITLTRKDTIGERPNLEESEMLRELDSMIGLSQVKSAVHGLMEFQLQNYDREMRGELPESISLNRVFYGNPGTGKTTVARLYGCLLREFGLLSDGDLIAVTASDLMGDHVGAGATKTNEIIAKAKGKVLFIDEAYVLDPNRRGGNAFGGSVLDTLVEKIEGSAGADMAVILAGYEGEMQALFRNCGNPGLARRFNPSESLRFEDFDDDQLRCILKRMAAKERLVIAPHTAQEVVRIIARGRRLDGFGNAGAVETFIGRGKVNKAARLVKQLGARSEAQRRGVTPLPPAPRPDVLVLEDFITDETSGQKARDQFSNMCNMEHIFKLIDRLEATLIQSKEEGKTTADILSNFHMVFTGPPGTGKTTAARKFGKLFFNLDLLPTDRVIETTGKTMLGQYVGQTETLVTERMKEAKGGILFIDEAYGLFPSRGSYGGDALQALLDNMTKPEFKGNLIVILAGYEKHIDALLGVNPGLRGRFDKIRLPFPSWTGQQSAEAAFQHIEHDNKTITAAAKTALTANLKLLSKLPDWSSARDVYETVLPAMYTYRAERLAQEAAAAAKKDGSLLSSTAKSRSFDVATRVGPLPPYEVSDVNRSCMPLITTRRKVLAHQHGNNPMDSMFPRTDEDNVTRSFNDMAIADDEDDDQLYSAPLPPLPDDGGGQQQHPRAGAGARMAPPPTQAKLKYKTLEKDPDTEEGGDGDEGIPGLMAMLEEACAEKGYDPSVMEKFLATGNLPKDLVELVWEKNGGSESKYAVNQVRTALVKQSAPLLTKVRQLLKQMAEIKSAEERKKQEKLKKIGKCCMGFEWLKTEGGYRCAGGTHFCSDQEIEQCEL